MLVQHHAALVTGLGLVFLGMHLLSMTLIALKIIIINNNFSIFTIEKRHARNRFGNPTSEEASRVVAGEIRDRNDSTDVLFYWNADISYDTIYQTLFDRRIAEPRDFELDENSVTGVSFPWRNIAFRDFWRDTANNQVASSQLTGVFVDAFFRNELYGTDVRALAAITDLNGLVIYNGYRVTGTNVLAHRNVLDVTDGVFVEAFFHQSVDTTAEGHLLMDELVNNVPSDKYILCRGAAGSFGTDFRFSHVAYLMVANDKTFYSWGGSNNSYDADDSMTFFSTTFNINTGPPLGKATRDGDVWTRSFENATVTINMASKTSNITLN